MNWDKWRGSPTTPPPASPCQAPIRSARRGLSGVPCSGTDHVEYVENTELDCNPGLGTLKYGYTISAKCNYLLPDVNPTYVFVAFTITVVRLSVIPPSITLSKPSKIGVSNELQHTRGWISNLHNPQRCHICRKGGGVGCPHYLPCAIEHITLDCLHHPPSIIITLIMVEVVIEFKISKKHMHMPWSIIGLLCYNKWKWLQIEHVSYGGQWTVFSPTRAHMELVGSVANNRLFYRCTELWSMYFSPKVDLCPICFHKLFDLAIRIMDFLLSLGTPCTPLLWFHHFQWLALPMGRGGANSSEIGKIIHVVFVYVTRPLM